MIMAMMRVVTVMGYDGDGFNGGNDVIMGMMMKLMR